MWSYWVDNKEWALFRSSFLKTKIKNGHYQCRMCKKFFCKDKIQVDHRLALSHGGMQFWFKNLRVLCKECHRVKTKADIRELRMSGVKQFFSML